MFSPSSLNNVEDARTAHRAYNPRVLRATDPSGLTSLDLLALVRQGDRAALEILFERYATPLRRWTSGKLPRWARDIADTQDLVQDTLLQTFKRIELFTPERSGALEAYLRQAVMNRIRDEFRRRRRRAPATAVDSQHPADDPSPYERAVGAELAGDYERALACLRDEERAAIVGRIEMGLSYEELAQTLDKATPNAARMTVVRALIRLAEEMGRV
jgi:RNA polymerase sigma-70 factor (ECF subfamily)